MLTLLVLGATIGVMAVVSMLGKTEREAIAALKELEAVVRAGASERLLEIIVLPAAVRDRAPAERDRLLLEIFRGEITPEGIESLRRDGEWGALAEVFPEEAVKWTQPTGVDPAKCMAFRRDGGDFRAEAVVYRDGDGLRLLRCNNVR